MEFDSNGFVSAGSSTTVPNAVEFDSGFFTTVPDAVEFDSHGGVSEGFSTTATYDEPQADPPTGKQPEHFQPDPPDGNAVEFDSHGFFLLDPLPKYQAPWSLTVMVGFLPKYQARWSLTATV